MLLGSMIKQHAFSMRKTFVQGMLSMMKDSYSTALPKLELIEVSAPCKNVYHICLNQPNSRNAFTLPMWRELKSVIDFLANNPKCRSIVISGAGKSFCAGIDLKDGISEIVNLLKREDLDVARKSRLLGNIITVCQDSFTSLEKCPKPVIAAIHGHCIGAGINLIAATDIRYASLDAVFSIREVALGIAADVGILNRINKIVGNDSLTRELAYTGRNIGCSEALKYGIISRKFLSPEDCVQASLKLASEIATLSPIAVQGTKFTLNYSRDHGVDDSMNFIRAWNQSQLQSDDLASSFLAFTQKEPVEYGDV